MNLFVAKKMGRQLYYFVAESARFGTLLKQTLTQLAFAKNHGLDQPHITQRG
jgi:hypothetical protein